MARANGLHGIRLCRIGWLLRAIERLLLPLRRASDDGTFLCCYSGWLPDLVYFGGSRGLSVSCIAAIFFFLPNLESTVELHVATEIH